MTTVDRVKMLCNERGIPISVLEKRLGFSNAYFAGLKKGSLPDDRLKKVADYFGVSVGFLISGSSSAAAPVDESTLRISGMLLSHPELVDICSAYVKASAERQNIICDLLGVKRDAFSTSEKEA